MIYYEVHENGPVLRAYRNALKNDPNICDTANVDIQMRQLGESNNMKVCGQWETVPNNWETTGFEFPDEKSLTVFLLRWA